MTTPAADPDRALAGRRIAVPEARQLDVLAGLLERRGASVLRCPLIGIKDTPDQAPVVAWLQRRIAAADDLLVFYTGEGIERLVAAAQRAGLEAQFVEALRASPKLTRGPKPKRALRRLDLDPQFEAAAPTTDGLLTTIAAIELPTKRVAVQLYNPSQDTRLLDHLRGRGVEADTVAPYVYASAAEDEQVVALIDELRAGRVDAIAFTSKAQVQRLTKLARDRGLEAALRGGLARTRVAAIGPVVRAELAAAGCRVDAMPDDPFSMKPLVTSIAAMFGR